MSDYFTPKDFSLGADVGFVEINTAALLANKRLRSLVIDIHHSCWLNQAKLIGALESCCEKLEGYNPAAATQAYRKLIEDFKAHMVTGENKACSNASNGIQ